MKVEVRVQMKVEVKMKVKVRERAWVGRLEIPWPFEIRSGSPFSGHSTSTIFY